MTPRIFALASAMLLGPVLTAPAVCQSPRAADLSGKVSQRYRAAQFFGGKPEAISAPQLVGVLVDKRSPGRGLAQALLILRVLQDPAQAELLVERIEKRSSGFDVDLVMAECIGLTSPPMSDTALGWIHGADPRLQALGFAVLCRSGAAVDKAQAAIDHGLQSQRELVAMWAARACATLRTYSAATPGHLGTLAEAGSPVAARWAIWALQRTATGTEQLRQLARRYVREQQEASGEVDLVACVDQLVRAPDGPLLQRMLAVPRMDVPSAEKATVLRWLADVEVEAAHPQIAGLAAEALERDASLAAPALLCLGRFAPRDDQLQAIALAHLSHPDPNARREACRLAAVFGRGAAAGRSDLRSILHESESAELLGAAVYALGSVRDDEDATWDRIRALYLKHARDKDLDAATPEAELAGLCVWAMNRLRPGDDECMELFVRHIDTRCRPIMGELMHALWSQGRRALPALRKKAEQGTKSALLSETLGRLGQLDLARGAAPEWPRTATIGVGGGPPSLAAERRVENGEADDATWLLLLDECLVGDQTAARVLAKCPESLRPVAVSALVNALASSRPPRLPMKFLFDFELPSQAMKFAVPEPRRRHDTVLALHVACCRSLSALGAAASPAAGILEWVGQVGDEPVAAEARKALLSVRR